ncbi:dihydrofolate reductase family protein [Knoellia sp. LjRoot47]|uniref:dihydrofolate reductase family protein n=1 Tax=Knoellia sp. LjRoot47 TaxID=3342330 RepID=UPI003ECE1082
MSRVLVTQLSISLDGYGTGEPQTLDEPFGHAGQRLHRWLFADEPGGDRVSTGVDAAFGAVGWDGSVGAEIMGRRKFWPYAGEWTDPEWKGWWGPNPPFHTPVFVLTHHPRESIVMEGGTTFHFLDATPEEAVSRAKEAAAGKDVRIGGGPSTVREFVRAGVVDVMHVVVVPIVLGRGESLWEGLGDIDSRFDVEAVASPASGVTHLTFTRKAS